MSTTTVFIYTLNQAGAPGKWSRYVYPFVIDNFAQLGDDLYIRSGDDVLKVDPSAVTDYAGDTTVPTRSAVFPGIVQWPWLDFGNPGANKGMVGLDFVGTGAPNLQIGYDQSNPLAYTVAFALPEDTVPGMVIPFPITAPSMSVKVSYPGGYKWKLQAVNLYLNDERTGA